MGEKSGLKYGITTTKYNTPLPLLKTKRRVITVEAEFCSNHNCFYCIGNLMRFELFCCFVRFDLCSQQYCTFWGLIFAIYVARLFNFAVQAIYIV